MFVEAVSRHEIVMSLEILDLCIGDRYMFDEVLSSC